MANKPLQTSKRQAAYQKFEDKAFHHFFVSELAKIYGLEKELSIIISLKHGVISEFGSTPYRFLQQETLIKILRLDQVFMLIDEQPVIQNVKILGNYFQTLSQQRSGEDTKTFEIGFAILRLLHYKQPVYRFLKTYATKMNRTDIAELLNRTLSNDQMLIKTVIQGLIKH
ncbi:DUF892 family protein [Pedobacter agri]|uniref:DUF892 family protein n=1 Tax=Pedobacter agri TaxID=454586 RepID=UPI00292CCC5C|nr:DUF892 family protein [Pedobacter agri]